MTSPRMIGYEADALSADFELKGPPGSMYEGGAWRIRVRCEIGYPRIPPSVLFLNRILHISVLSQLDGTGQLLHLHDIWDSASWNLTKLLQHLEQCLGDPVHVYQLLPFKMKEIVDRWMEVSHGESELDHDDLEASFESFSRRVHDAMLPYISEFPKLDQMHLNVIALFASNPGSFSDYSQQYIQRFASTTTGLKCI